jgi:hypothetical protein
MSPVPTGTTPITELLFGVGRRFLGPVMMMMMVTTMMIVVIVMGTTKMRKAATVEENGDDDLWRCDAAATVSKI